MDNGSVLERDRVGRAARSRHPAGTILQDGGIARSYGA